MVWKLGGKKQKAQRSKVGTKAQKTKAKRRHAGHNRNQNLWIIVKL